MILRTTAGEPLSSETAESALDGLVSRAARLFTVGHSNHEPEAFLALLRRYGVMAVADVRSSPYSRLPHFSRVFAQRFGVPPSVYRREGFGQAVLVR